MGPKPLGRLWMRLPAVSCSNSSASSPSRGPASGSSIDHPLEDSAGSSADPPERERIKSLKLLKPPESPEASFVGPVMGTVPQAGGLQASSRRAESRRLC